jgi:hypothetical protein
MWRMGLLLTLLLVVTPALACDFQYDPISSKQYYRASGWMLPAVGEFKSYGPLHQFLIMNLGIVPAAIAEELRQDTDNVVEFPAQEFSLDSAPKIMRSAKYDAGIARWKVNGRVIAYSYVMEPVEAHKVNGKWRVDARAACIFTGTFIDDRGDGVFRVLVPGTLKPDLIPKWARQEQSSN